MKKNRQFALTFTLFTALITGCASNTNYTSTANKDSWRLQGKIGLTYPDSRCQGDKCRNKSDQGKIDWTQKKQTYTVTLSDPFGRVVMNIEGNNESLTAQSPGQRPIQTTPNDFIQLLTENAGGYIAVSKLNPNLLRHWVTGRPAPQSSVSEKKGEQFVQLGYRVIAKQWRDTHAGKMPSLITISRDDFTLRLVVRDWLKAK